MVKNLKPKYYEKLFGAIPEAIVLADSRGTVLKVNDAFCKMYGYTIEEACGQCIDDLIAPDADHPAAANITRAVAQGEQFTLETVRRRKDGTRVHVSLLAVPVSAEGEDAVVFGVYRDISDRKEAEQALQESRKQLEKAYHQLEITSNQDGLTGIANRRHFESFLDREWRRQCREKKPVSLIMIDIDHFKRYNDAYGHLAGDQCLKQVAQALLVVHRASDLVARYGGEEFVAVLSGTRMEDAKRIAERMRQRVKEQGIPHAQSKVADHVTISLGVASHLPTADGDPMSLVAHADQALYQAKSSGRDRVETHVS